MSEDTPTPAQIVEALRLLGYTHISDPNTRPDGPTDEDYPELIGQLQAVADITSISFVREADRLKSFAAYRELALNPTRMDNWPIENSQSPSWHTLLLLIAVSAMRVAELHSTEAPSDPTNLDAHVGAACTYSARIVTRLSALRLSVDSPNLDDDKFAKHFGSVAAEVHVLYDELLKLAAGPEHNHGSHKHLDEGNTPYLRYVEKDLGDDYAEFMAGELDRMANEGYIDRWEHQPNNGSGNGSIVLWGSKDGDFVMNYDNALEYARGFLDAVDQIKERAENSAKGDTTP